MGKFFNADNPIMRFLLKVSDMVWLNILFIVCCIPIVTIGAANSALYYVMMRMSANEEGYVTHNFFSAFKNNFKQATIAWLIILVIAAVCGVNIYYLLSIESEYLGYGIIPAILILLAVAFIGLYIFPLIAKFENSLKQQVKNAFFISLTQVPKTVLMLVFSSIPFLLLLNNLKWFPLLVLGAFSLIVYANAGMMNRIFEKFMPQKTD